jgi:hypothetical protein
MTHPPNPPLKDVNPPAWIGHDRFRHVFRTNPNSVEWGYTHNVKTFDTLGGRVTQLLSVSIDTVRVAGDAVHRRELQRFAGNMQEIMGWQVKTQLPVDFAVPSKGWRFRCYIESVPQIGWEVDTVTYPWQLALSVEEDLGIASERLLRKELQRLAKGIGFPDPKWHGGSVKKLRQIWSKAKSELKQQFPGGGGTGGGGGGAAHGGSGKDYSKKRYFSMEELADLVLKFWSKADAPLAVAVAWAEASGDAKNTNTNTDGSVDRGLFQINDEAHPSFSDKEAFDPESNVRYAHDYWVRLGHTFGTTAGWMAYTSGSYKKHLARARDAVAKVTSK